MRYIKSLLVLCLAVLVVGCTTPRPPMSDAVAQQTAFSTAVIVRCYEAGEFDADTVAAGRTMVNNFASRYTYDTDQLLRMAQNYSVADATSKCKEMAVTIASYRQQVAANQRSAPATPQYQYVQPARTICNNIAGQILCSTY